ncbi:hypothetical protein GZ77_07780 [Endozoicomonas montiporae]|uniref:2Fe-2S ferredoxin-type domain-containing protein n=2 Tax=Endozoicomonas montiporae TaxID=1027273 RepID=A0A081N776_9GAMM|nr:2Fe-2S iron-sulfur cluster-binding protein [Endozoicomonas montiporae]AMO55879.1 oxidoreductase FAD/NAD(P)-binding domain protein [Endozoicomonas montiporae CL-33]KEQ14299.1 hypothetical protein GZ77_07780 [Endozoicomonas montiporae]
MPLITFAGHTYQASSEKPLLDSLLAYRLPIPHSCQSGFCHSCLMKADKGQVPACSQKSLSNEKIRQGYFLACQCVPEQDIEISLPVRNKIPGIITGKTLLTSTLVALDIAPRHPFHYEPGQLVTLWAEETLRSVEPGADYSEGLNELARPCYLASLSGQDASLTVHIQRRASRKFSQWAHDCTQIGQKISIGDVRGANIYQQLSSSNLIVVQDGCLAPVLPLLRKLCADTTASEKSVTLVLQVDHTDNLYEQALIHRLVRQSPNLSIQVCGGLQGKKQLETIMMEPKPVYRQLIIAGDQGFIKKHTQQVQMDIQTLPYS